MKNLLNDYIFPSFITSVDVSDEIDNVELLKECYWERDLDKLGVEKSNIGGWHSDVCHGLDSEGDNLNKLSKTALTFGNEIAMFHELKVKFTKIDWWININPEHTYNAVHVHPKADLSIVYYAKVNSENGTLGLIRNDGAMHMDLFDKRPELLKYNLTPVVGRMYGFPSHLLHHTLSNTSKEDRVTIAFNLSI